jgi:hypothetical protein
MLALHDKPISFLLIESCHRFWGAAGGVSAAEAASTKLKPTKKAITAARINLAHTFLKGIIFHLLLKIVIAHTMSFGSMPGDRAVGSLKRDASLLNEPTPSGDNHNIFVC